MLFVMKMQIHVFERFISSMFDVRVILNTILKKFQGKIFVADAGYLGVKYQKVGIENDNIIRTPCHYNMKV
jgi:phosphoribosylformylglycinamidine (FGAM) synthase-like enzyme